MPDLWFAVPGDPETRTGGYIYAKRLTAALRVQGWNVHPVRLPGSFPNPSSGDLGETRKLLAALPARASILIDGLAFGALPVEVLAGLDLKITALVHHPLALETGLTPEDAQTAARRERSALTFAGDVIVTSPHTADVLAADYGVARAQITIALPGVDRQPQAQGSHPPNLLTVATVTPRKGHDVLVAALARIKDLVWTSTIAGSLERAPACVAALRAQIANTGLTDRVTLTGELSDGDLAACYRRADVFVLPSRYEGYGMVFADALTAGLPVIACAAGAVADTVPAAASKLVPMDDVSAVADALRAVLTDQTLRQSMADAAWTAGRTLPTWDDCAAAVAKALTA